MVATARLSFIGLFLGVRRGYTQHPHFEERKSSVNRSLHSHAVSKGGSPSLKHHTSIQGSSATFCPGFPPPRLSWGPTAWLTDNAGERLEHEGKRCAKNKGSPGLLGNSSCKQMNRDGLRAEMHYGKRVLKQFRYGMDITDSLGVTECRISGNHHDTQSQMLTKTEILHRNTGTQGWAVGWSGPPSSCHLNSSI